MLDSRAPGGGGAQQQQGNYAEEEQRRIADVERRVEELMVEARWWRVANSAQWVAWGIVQANIPELEEWDRACRTPSAGAPGGEVEDMEKLDLEDGGVDGKGDCGEGAATATAAADGGEVAAGGKEGVEEGENGSDGEEKEDDEFDYVAYAQDRAMFFWGDCVALGLVKLEDLPKNVQEAVKIVDY